MRIIHLEMGMNLYGGALQVLYLLEGLQRAGISSLLIAPRGSAVAQEAQRRGVEVRPVPYRGELDPRPLAAALKETKGTKGVIIHAHSRRGADLWGAAAARLSGAPLVVTRRVDNPEGRLACRFKYGRAAAVVAISRAIAGVLARGGVEPGKIRIISSGVDTTLYRPGGDHSWFRREFGLEPHELTVGMVAQFIPRKGHTILLAAAQQLAERHPNCRFLFFGKGPLEEAVRREAAERGLQRRCLFCGFRQDLPLILPCLDLLVHPATMEGLGVALLQASACGIPLVAARAGGIPEVVKEGETGVLVEPGDPAALAAALDALISDPELRLRMGKAGRRWIEERFSTEEMVRRYLELYHEVILQRGGG